MSEEKKVFTVTGQDGAEWRVAGTGWSSVNHVLSVHGGAPVVAEFAPGQWAAVIDEANRAPAPVDALAELAASWLEPVGEAVATHDDLVEQTARLQCARQLLAAIGQPS